MRHRHVCDHFPALAGGDAHWCPRLESVPALPPPERRPAVTRTSRYLVMRDGVRVAIDVHLPADALARGARLPTLLRQTRYYRSLAFTPLGARWISPDLLEGEAVTRARFLAHGYAWVDVDARGSGASFGERPHPWSRDEVQDGVEVLDWIVSQPWSNGRVGSTGVSYDGTAAEHLATRGHPALRAIAPRFSLYDVYTDIAFPGGIQLAWFTRNWSRYNRALDRDCFDEALAGTLRLFGHGVRSAPAASRRLRGLASWLDRDTTEALLRWVARQLVVGVRAVDEDRRRALLAAALASHARNHDPHADAEALTFRDDSPPGRPDFTPDSFSPHAHLEQARAAGIAIASVSGWHDSAYPPPLRHQALPRRRQPGVAARAGSVGARRRAPDQPARTHARDPVRRRRRAAALLRSAPARPRRRHRRRAAGPLLHDGRGALEERRPLAAPGRA